MNNIITINGRPPQWDNRPNHPPIYPFLLTESVIKSAEHFNNQSNKLIIKT